MGVGRGQWGEGITVTSIHMDKIKGGVVVGEGGGTGWGGVEGRGEKCRQL